MAAQKSNDTVKIPATLRREVQITKGSVDKEKRTVPISFSSENPVRRYTDDGDPYNEILDHSPSSVKMGRMASGNAPLLMHHDPADQVGVLEDARIDADTKRGVATARFSRSTRGTEVMNDVDDGIRGPTSVGYQVHAMWQDEDSPEDGDGVPNYRCSWEPLEASLESLPADETVGANRNHHTKDPVTIPIKRKATPSMNTRTRVLAPAATENGGSAITPEELQTRVTEATKKDKLRVKTILDLTTQFRGRVADIDTIAREHIDNDKSEDEFTRCLLTKMTNLTPITRAAATDTTIGMTPKETQQYSFVKAIRQLSDNNGHGKLDGLEKEAHEAAMKRTGRELNGPRGFIVPEDVMRAKFRGEGWAPNRRDMQAGVFPLGGATVETEVLGESLIEILRNKMFVVKAGAQTMSGLKNNVAIPRQTAATTAYWLGEIQPATESDPALQQLLLTPHRLAANTAYSQLLLIQSTLDAEQFVRNDMMSQLALAKDLAAISGTGGAQPIGIINTTGVGTMSFTSGTPTLAQIISLETIVANANADIGKLAYMLSTAGRGLLKQTPILPGGTGAAFPVFFWQNPINPADAQAGIGTINGYPAYATNQLNTNLNGNKVIFGNWQDIIIADWEGWEVLVDPYTLSKNGEVQVTVSSFTDIGLRHPGSFAFSTNSLV